MATSLLCTAAFGRPPPKAPIIRGTGTVVLAGADQRDYAILGDDGILYLPSRLPGELRSDGQRVRFSARHAKASPPNNGREVQLVSIRALAAGEEAVDPKERSRGTSRRIKEPPVPGGMQ